MEKLEPLKEQLNEKFMHHFFHENQKPLTWLGDNNE